VRGNSANVDKPSRVLMIGLDGATFDLIRPWVEEGGLPNLGRLMKEGSWAPMRSTFPPMTFPAWNAFMTGMNPAKHAIFDFTERRPDSYEVQFVNARQRKARTLWMRLSEAGKRVAVMGVPCTWPPERVNGVMISGFDAPRADADAMHPAGLHEELLREVGPYRITSNIIRDIDGGRPEAALDSILKTVEVKAATAKYL
jgi:predicted AlkP superfamily phosphohydrolase/phosphomutase